jgi:hypothetical protein
LDLKITQLPTSPITQFQRGLPAAAFIFAPHPASSPRQMPRHKFVSLRENNSFLELKKRAGGSSVISRSINPISSAQVHTLNKFSIASWTNEIEFSWSKTSQSDGGFMLVRTIYSSAKLYASTLSDRLALRIMLLFVR